MVHGAAQDGRVGQRNSIFEFAADLARRRQANGRQE